jgi:hypothetical protein
MAALLVVIVGFALLPLVALWIWRLQRRVIGSLVPGAEFKAVATLADLPVARLLHAPPPVVTGPTVELLGVTREAKRVLLAYRPVSAANRPVRTVLVQLVDRGHREMAVLEGWRAARTPLVVATDALAGEVAIQQPLTRLTLTLPMVA